MKRVLITGGTGTLGRAIIERQIDQWRMTVYSRSELRQAQLLADYPTVGTVLGDVRDYDRLHAAIAGHDMVIHLAAMKRVPECNQQPQECYKTNVIGSQNVVRACRNNNVEVCLGTSTDKACRAITMYGASKLAMESIFQAGGDDTDTQFILLRYGNVIASNGSVIPIWREQVRQGKPITITDRRCTRFWMTPSDAVDLVMWSLKNLGRGEIAVPKMGKLSLVEMAEIVAPGHPVVEVGLRSYEKIHEDLVHPDESALDAPHHYILGAGKTGSVYTSEMAPTISAEAFRRMIG